MYSSDGEMPEVPFATKRAYETPKTNPTISLNQLLQESAQDAPFTQDAFWQGLHEQEEPADELEVEPEDVALEFDETAPLVRRELCPHVRLFTRQPVFPYDDDLSSRGFCESKQSDRGICEVELEEALIGWCPPLENLNLSRLSFDQLVSLSLEVQAQRILGEIRAEWRQREIETAQIAACPWLKNCSARLVFLTRLTGNVLFVEHGLRGFKVEEDLIAFYQECSLEDLMPVLRVTLLLNAYYTLQPPAEPQKLAAILSDLLAALPRSHQLIHVACLRYLSRLHTLLRLLLPSK